MKKIILLHCFPTPYRNYLFTIFNKYCNQNNINFEVYFFSKNDPSRPGWNFESKDLDFPHVFWKPIFRRKAIFHFNPSLLINLFLNKPNILILGGVWSSINNILLSQFWSSNLIVWDELNRFDNQLSVKRKSGSNFIDGELDQFHFNGKPHISFFFLKKRLLKRIKNFALPGIESKSYLLDLLGEERFGRLNLFYLPNLIEDKLFSKDLSELDNLEISDIKIKYNIKEETKIAFWPARFDPVKGILNFLKYASRESFSDWVILIVGHGELRSSINEYIVSNSLSEYVKLIDSMPYEKVRLLYKISDLFLLPSLSDSNPLTVVEALHSSLPILISNKVGNYNEALVDNLNGYSLDPYNKESVFEISKIMFSKSTNELKMMGKNSQVIAEKYFDTNKVMNDFFSKLTQYIEVPN